MALQVNGVDVTDVTFNGLADSVTEVQIDGVTVWEAEVGIAYQFTIGLGSGFPGYSETFVAGDMNPKEWLGFDIGTVHFERFIDRFGTVEIGSSPSGNLWGGFNNITPVINGVTYLPAAWSGSLYLVVDPALSNFLVANNGLVTNLTFIGS